MRPDKISWYFQIAKDVALRSPCISRRRFGAILVKDDAIISTGYAGTVRGAINCGIDCTCLKDLYDEEPYKSYEHCCSIHGEMNAIINAARAGIKDVYYYKKELGELQPSGFLSWTNVHLPIFHENVEDWIKLENEWIQDQIRNAPKKE